MNDNLPEQTPEIKPGNFPNISKALLELRYWR